MVWGILAIFSLYVPRLPGIGVIGTLVGRVLVIVMVVVGYWLIRSGAKKSTSTQMATKKPDAPG